jgi:hypothetical protein
MNKVILILADGLRYDTAMQSMGYLGHLVETMVMAVWLIVKGFNPAAIASGSATVNISQV